MRKDGGAVAAGLLLLWVSLNIAGSSLGDVDSARESGGSSCNDNEASDAVCLRGSGAAGDDDDELCRAAPKLHSGFCAPVAGRIK